MSGLYVRHFERELKHWVALGVAFFLAETQSGAVDLLAYAHAVEEAQAEAVWVSGDGGRETSVLLEYLGRHVFV